MCRPWYQLATSRDALTNKSEIPGLGSSVCFAQPYTTTTTGGNKNVVITASRAVKDANNNVLGVVGTQINLDFVSQLLTSSPVLTNGYIFLLDQTDGTVVLYPKAKLPVGLDIFSRRVAIQEVEFNNNTNRGSNFLSLVKTLSTQQKSQTFNKTDSNNVDQLWSVSSAKVNNTDFIVVLVVPNSDVTALSDSMNGRTRIFSIVATILVLVLLMLLTFLSWRIANNTSKKVLAPVRELTDWLSQISKANLAIEIGDRPPVSAELNTIYYHFRNLLTAVRFGNEAYYAGNLQRALKNYEAAEKMMTEFNNTRGLGVVYNNKG
ncbi:hypothetical protein HK096_002734, partial [Nowakowskiella sp. JEL0078]